MKKFSFVYLHSYSWQTFSVYALELSLFTSHGQTLFTFKDQVVNQPTAPIEKTIVGQLEAMQVDPSPPKVNALEIEQ